MAGLERDGTEPEAVKSWRRNTRPTAAGLDDSGSSMADAFAGYQKASLPLAGRKAHPEPLQKQLPVRADPETHRVSWSCPH
jgi:hypothetical protein